MSVTAEDVAELLASAPPRKISARVAKAAQGASSFAFLAFIGIFFAGFGAILVGLFFPWHFLDEWSLSASSGRVTSGTIAGFSDTGMSINDTKVVKYDFRYSVGGRSFQG